MGDTFDDWLVDKIQLLRKGRIIAFAVKRVEQVSLRLYLYQRRFRHPTVYKGTNILCSVRQFLISCTLPAYFCAGSPLI